MGSTLLTNAFLHLLRTFDLLRIGYWNWKGFGRNWCEPVKASYIFKLHIMFSINM